MKKILIPLFILLVAAAFVLGFAALRTGDLPGSAAPQIETQSVKEEKENYSIDIKYPKLSGLSEVKLKAVNDIFVSDAQRSIDTFRVDASTESISIEGVKSQLISEYETIFLDKNFLSVKFTDFYYIAGMAHPQTTYRGFNYDLSSGKKLTLADFFEDGADFLPELAEKAREKVKARLEADNYYFPEMAEPGTEPKIENYSEFNFSDTGLTIIFNPYSVAPYVAGPVFVSIPYADLSLSNKDGGGIERVVK